MKDSVEFNPSSGFVDSAAINKQRYETEMSDAMRDPLAFWARAAQEIVWQKPFDTVLEWELPFAKWFGGGKLNATESCLDRHVASERKDKLAILWEGENGDVRTLTYQQLFENVCKFARVLTSKGIGAGDRVAIYMPLIPEAAIAILACARIGATHSVVFGGFSAESLADRIQDAECKAVITADGLRRKGRTVELKNVVDAALQNNNCPSIRHVFVYSHLQHSVTMIQNRDSWWHDELAAVNNDCMQDSVSAFDAEHPLFILYTSGTTGKPKGIVHSTGGYLTQTTISTSWVFDLKDTDIYWCTADVGWITGHSYVIYGPLSCGATVFMYEGAPTYPQPDRFWELIDKHQITILYTSPTAIRTFMRFGDDFVSRHKLDSLRLLGSVGEPINPEAWIWYHKIVGKGRCPIVDTWWQTETGGIMITPMPAVTKTMPGSATRPFPGIEPEVWRADGTVCAAHETGALVIRNPWPSMTRGIWGDKNGDTFKQIYWSQFPGVYFTGDEAKKDENGYFWILGRCDDVVNVSGHRLGTMEIESALVSHPYVAEAAVVARPDDITGQAVVAFVTPKEHILAGALLKRELNDCVARHIGSFAKPTEIHFAKVLPKTRSGKIMRRLLREWACTGQVNGDTTSLEDNSAIASLGA